MPSGIQLTLLGLIIGVLALAQRLGGWEHKALARCIGLLAAGGVVVWCVAVLPGWFGWGGAVVAWSVCVWLLCSWRYGPVREALRTAEGELGSLRSERRSLQQQLGERQSELDEVRGMLSGVQQQLSETAQQLAKKGEKLAEMEREDEQVRIRSEKVWRLKRHAREIKRRWPTSDFAWYPEAKALWVNPAPLPPSLSDSANNREWLPDAIAWHDALSAYDFTVRHDAAFLNSLDFDELMEHLDRDERARRKILDSEDPERPIVVAEYGTKPGDGAVYGVHVSNLGNRTAYDVKIAPLRFGRHRVFFSERLSVLDAGHGKVFLDMAVRMPGGSIQGEGLFEIMNRWRVEADCWEFPMLLRIVYRDIDSHWYMSTSFLEQDAGDRQSHFVVCRPRPASDESLVCVKG